MYSRPIWKSTLLLALTWLSVENGYATDYYVRTAGSDGNAGTSYANAYRSIQKALNSAQAGSTIYVEEGVYYERLLWRNSGTMSAPIILTNYNSGTVIIDGFNATNSRQRALLQIASKSHLRVQGIQFRNNIRSYAQGLYIIGSGKNVHVTGCQFYNIGWTRDKNSIPTSEDNANPLSVIGNSTESYSQIYIGNNKIYNCIPGFSESMTITGNVEHFLVEGNQIHDNTNIGIDVAGHYAWTKAPEHLNQARNGIISQNIVYNCVSLVAPAAGIYVDGGKWITIERNQVYKNGAGISIGCENDGKTAEGVIVRSNWIFQNIQSGIYFGANQPRSSVKFCVVANNTFFKNYTQGGYGSEVFLQNSESNEFHQNILVPRTNQCVAFGRWEYSTTNLTLEYNLIWRYTGNQTNLVAGVSIGSNTIIKNPLLVNTEAAMPDLHLGRESPAINAGRPSFQPSQGELDIDGQARLQGNRVDIGADEYVRVLRDVSLRELIAADEYRVRLSPNPLRRGQLLSVKLDKQLIECVWLYDQHGRLAGFSPGSSEEVLLETAHLSVGFYQILVRTETGKYKSEKCMISY